MILCYNSSKWAELHQKGKFEFPLERRLLGINSNKVVAQKSHLLCHSTAIYFENKTLLKDHLYSSLIDDLSLLLPFY